MRQGKELSARVKHVDKRHGARQPERFNPERAAKPDDPARFEYLPSEEVATLLDIPAAGKVADFGTGTGGD